jgi:hypothetical protein
MKLTRGQWIALAISLLMALPALSVGYYADDWIHEARQQGLVHGFGPTWTGLFEFARAGEVGGTPGPSEWWASEIVKVRFFRPLTSITVALDHKLGPVLGHVHGLLWFSLLVWLAARWLRRVLPERDATIATFIYAMGEHHAATYTWISGRTSALVGALSLLTLEAHGRDRDDGRAVSWWGSLCFVLALGGGEGSLGVLAWLFAFEWLRARQEARALSLPALSRSLGSYALIALAYLAYYSRAGYGTLGSAAYRNPITDPISFAMAAPQRAVMLVGDAFTGAPSDFHTITAGAFRASIVWGVFIAIALLLLVLRLRKRASDGDRALMDVMLLGFFASMAPGLGAPPGGRVLVLSALGSSSLLAMLFVRARESWRSDRSTRARVAMVMVGVFHFALAPMLRLVQPAALRPVVLAHQQMTQKSRLEPHCARTDEVLLLAAPDPIPGLYGNVVWNVYRRDEVRLFRTLSATPADHELARIDANTIELAPIATTFLQHPLEQLVRDPRQSIGLGAEFALRREGPLAPFPGEGRYRATVRVVEMRDGYPAKIRVTFNGPIEGAGVCFATGFAGAIRSMPIPPVGARVRLQYAPGAMGL